MKNYRSGFIIFATRKLKNFNHQAFNFEQPCPGGEIGRRTVFRWQHPKGCAGSNPVPGTKPPEIRGF